MQSARDLGEIEKLTIESLFIQVENLAEFGTIMPSGKQRSSANAPDSFSVSVNERILKECHDLYTEEERGIVFLRVTKTV